MEKVQPRSHLGKVDTKPFFVLPWFRDKIIIMNFDKKITEPYSHIFEVAKSGLVAIFVSARCKSKKQTQAESDENLRVEIYD